MSCKICNRGACASWMHSAEEQEKYDERQLMTNNVEDLQREIQGLKDEIKDLKEEIKHLKDEINQLREIQELKDEVKKLKEKRENEHSVTTIHEIIPPPPTFVPVFKCW